MTNLARAFLLLGVTQFLSPPATPSAAGQSPERIELPAAKFATGDDPARSRVDFDDGEWKEISTSRNFEPQGFGGYDGYSWYRIHVRIPSAFKTTSHWQERLQVHVSSIDDVDQTWFNGVEIGKTGTFPDDSAGYVSRWQAERDYYVDLKRDVVRWDQDNVIAIRVYDGGGPGGFYRDVPYLRMVEIVDGVTLDQAHNAYAYAPGQVRATLRLTNRFPVHLSGAFEYEVVDQAAGRTLEKREQPLALAGGGSGTVTITTP